MNARRKLIAALSEDSYGGIATLADVDHAEQLVDAHKAEVLAEADLLPKADVVAWLMKKEREIRAAGKRHHIAQAEAVAVLASKVERGAIRPNNLRMLPPDFFEPGRTYTEPDGSTDWKFRCDAITTHPEDGQRTALGWRHFQDEWTECAYREDEFEIHLIADALGTITGDSQ